LIDQVICESETDGDGFPRSRLGGNAEVTAIGFGREDRTLHRRKALETALADRVRKGFRDVVKLVELNRRHVRDFGLVSRIGHYGDWFPGWANARSSTPTGAE
jgi:hypothetical protein